MGGCPVSCIETNSRLIWEISGVGIQDKVSLVRRARQEDLEDADDPPKRGGGKGGNNNSKGRSAAEKRPPPLEMKVDKKLQLNIDKSCPDHNSKEGCTRRQADCPHELWHCCSRCGKHGHSALNCRLSG